MSYTHFSRIDDWKKLDESNIPDIGRRIFALVELNCIVDEEEDIDPFVDELLVISSDTNHCGIGFKSSTGALLPQCFEVISWRYLP